MGRMANTARRSPQSAIILYGRSRTATTSTATATTTTTTTTTTSSQVPDASPDAPPNDSRTSSDRKADLIDSLAKHNVTDSTYFQRSFYWRSQTTIQAVSSLATDVLEVFEQVPYVKIVASLIQKIITISDEIRSNKDRSRELVGKVMAYARVVFDALLGLDERTAIGLRQDLEELAKVLQSVYDVLQEITGPNYASLVNRLVYRNEIASMLQEQDRNLDTTITAFQLKSSIVNRSGSEKVEAEKEPPSYQAPTSSPPRLPSRTLGLRAKPQIVYGRSKEIELIISSLLSTRGKKDGTADGTDEGNVLPPKLCILGPGGIGKTTLALSVIHHDLVSQEYQGRRFFVSCEAATSPELFLNQLASSLGIAMEELKVSFLEAILQHLKKIACLVVLDNFETAWDPLHTRSEIETMLSEISSLTTVTLLLTMRGSQQPAGTRWSNIVPPLQPVDIDSAISIFTAISQKNDKYAVDLIRAVDCVPLAVTLLANLAAVDGETTESLWSRWEEESTSMVENGQDRLNSLETSVQLSLNSPRMQKDAGAIYLLSTLSLLPDGVSPSTLRACENNLPEVQSVKKAVSTLRQNALIYEDANKDLRILSPIRLFMCARHPPSTKSRSFIHEHFIALALQGNSYHDPAIRSRLQREVNNINAVLMYALNGANEKSLFGVVEAVINFCHFTYVSGQGSTLTPTLSRAIEKLESVKIAPKISVEPPVVTAPKAKKIWQRAFVGFGQSKYAKPIPTVVSQETAPSSTQINALKLRADCLGCFGQILSRQSQFDLAREKFELAKKLHIEVGDENAHAYDLLNIGLIYSRNIETLQQALEIITKAVNLHNKLGDKTGNAYDLLGLGHVHQDLCDFEEAETQFNLAVMLFAELGDDQGQAAGMNGLGTTLVSLSDFAGAEKYFNDAIRLNIALGDVVGEAENLGGLATTLLLRSRFTEAHRTIEKALSLRQPFTDPEHLHTLGRILIAMDDCEQAKSVLERSLSIQKEIGNRRGQAANLLYLGYIEFDHGNCQDARDLAEQALQIKNSSLMHAEINVLLAIINIRLMNLSKAGDLLESSQNEFSKAGNTLGEAYCVYVRAFLQLRRTKFIQAVNGLSHAFNLHTGVGNIQGQADDLNKICEALLSRGSIEEAMTLSAEALALHIQIDDKHGQGNDLYIQASLFLAQGRLSDAEQSARKALALHEASHSLYGIAKDSAILGYVFWQQQRQSDGDEKVGAKKSDTCLVYMERALDLFRRLGAVGEIRECEEQGLRMKGNESERPDVVKVSSWVPLTADSDHDSDDEDGYYYYDDSDEDEYEDDVVESEGEGDTKTRRVNSTPWVPLFPVYLHR
ncbi:hypothetical protein CVT25_001348 [Psilocybe cyanescens]|uniref:AAA+ ATPase domain-containing protein n=1 Tax=Psilocybe cyanescens TaxID=93625 RepID=A0A409XEU7_PSICY|nr:hypothetical protein CVT25_001348 [Psilocybe cyanescens]